MVATRSFGKRSPVPPGPSKPITYVPLGARAERKAFGVLLAANLPTDLQPSILRVDLFFVSHISIAEESIQIKAMCDVDVAMMLQCCIILDLTVCAVCVKVD